MKKTVFFHLYNDYSGSPRVLAILLQAMVKQGHQITLVTSNTEGFLSDIEGITYHIIPYRWSASKLKTSLLLLVAQFRLFFLALKLSKEADLFYLNTISPAAAAIAGRLKRIPVLYHVHEVYLHPNIVHRFYVAVWKRCSSQSIFVSNYVRNMYKQSASPVVYTALPERFIKDSILKEKLNEKPNILMISSLKKYKGVYQFIALAESLPQYSFHLVLNIEPADEFLKQNFVENLSVYSKQTNVKPFFSQADLVLNLSIPTLCVETFGLTILEAFTYGVPVICPPAGGPLELVSDGQEGYAVDARNLDELKQKIHHILFPEHYANFSEAAYKKSQRFKENEMISSIIQQITASKYA